MILEVNIREKLDEIIDKQINLVITYGASVDPEILESLENKERKYLRWLMMEQKNKNVGAMVEL